MQKRHKNKQQYFDEQALTTQKYVIPYLSDLMTFGKDITVFEIGCAEAGNLKPFLDLGCKATGIDLACGRIELAKYFFKDHKNFHNLELICEDIYNVKSLEKNFDVLCAM